MFRVQLKPLLMDFLSEVIRSRFEDYGSLYISIVRGVVFKVSIQNDENANQAEVMSLKKTVLKLAVINFT